jgi:hypothetical protein
MPSPRLEAPLSSVPVGQRSPFTAASVNARAGQSRRSPRSRRRVHLGAGAPPTGEACVRLGGQEQGIISRFVPAKLPRIGLVMGMNKSRSAGRQVPSKHQGMHGCRRFQDFSYVAQADRGSS